IGGERIGVRPPVAGKAVEQLLPSRRWHGRPAPCTMALGREAASLSGSPPAATRPRHTAMIRPTTRADQPTLVAMAQGTGVFKPMEIEALDGVFDEYFEEYQAQGHQAITYEDGGRLLGFAYYAPTWMTDRTWYLWWIVVKKD